VQGDDAVGIGVGKEALVKQFRRRRRKRRDARRVVRDLGGRDQLADVVEGSGGTAAYASSRA
jgi:hypothetical protein